MTDWMLAYADRRTAKRKAIGTYHAVIAQGGDVQEAFIESKKAAIEHIAEGDR